MQVSCPHCGGLLDEGRAAISPGQVVACPHCQGQLQWPGSPPPPIVTPAPAAASSPFRAGARIRPRRPRTQPGSSGAPGALIGLVLVLGLCFGCPIYLATNSGGGSSRPAEEWYQGGTLTRKTMLDWRRASQADRLASAGDLVAAGLGEERARAQWPQLRRLAEHFQRQMDQVAAPENGLSDEMLRSQPVAGTAAILWASMAEDLERLDWNVRLYCEILDRR